MNVICHLDRGSFIPLLLSTSAVLTYMPRVGRAEFLPVYGGPFDMPPIQYRAGGGTIRVNDAGLAVSNLGKYLYDPVFGGEAWLGQRAVRWDASGTSSELALDDVLSISSSSYASAITNAGTVVGAASRSDSTNSGGAVRWDASGTATELRRPSGFAGGIAYAMNDAGIIVGQADKFASLDPPFVHSGKWAIRWDASGAPTELGNLGTTPEGDAYSNPAAINNAGAAIGVSNKITPAGTELGPRAVRWDAGQTAATELGNLGTRPDGFTQTGAVAINDAGTAIGYADKYDSAGAYLGPSAVRWDASGTVAMELRHLGVHPEGYVASGAWAINDAGTIAGGAAKFDAQGNALGAHAVLWKGSDTAATELGNLGVDAYGRVDCAAFAINDAGTAVGWANAPDSIGDTAGSRAVYFRREDGAAIDLNTLIDPASGWLLLNAQSISNTGWIAGNALFNPNGPLGEYGSFRHFLIHIPEAAVPEPTSLALLALGLPLLVLRNSRRVIARHSAEKTKNPMTKYWTVLLTASLLAVVAPASIARGDIFQWEYINPANPSLGKQQNTTPAPGGAGVNAVPGAQLSYRNLTMAYLIGADLSFSISCGDEYCFPQSANLTGATLALADLTNAHLSNATLTNANFTGAEVSGANFIRNAYNGGTGISVAQLSSTASYQARDLTGIGLSGNYLNGVNVASQNLTGADFFDARLNNASLSQANLTNANFNSAALTNANLTGAEVRGADFGRNEYYGYGTGITVAQLSSTASYQARDLTGIRLARNDLAGINLASQNLTNAYFALATLTNANFTGAEVRGANFGRSGDGIGTGISVAQLSSTASYQARDLTGIGLGGNHLAGINFASQNLTGAYFSVATLTNANLSQANLTSADFIAADLTRANLTGAEVRGANFERVESGGISAAQLYSTASYQARDLTGIGLQYNILTGANFAGQNLSNASLEGATLTGAILSGAEVRGAALGRNEYSGDGTGITGAQLSSTASYQARDLTGIRLARNDLAGVNLASQNLTGAYFARATLTKANLSQANLTNAYFGSAVLTGANLTGAEVQGADFHIFNGGSGISAAQLYSTASYQAHDLTGIRLRSNNFAGINLVGQNLTHASLDHTTLSSANLSNANLSNAELYNANLTGANLSHANLTNTVSAYALLDNANLTGADARGAQNLHLPASSITYNLIGSTGRIGGLDLTAGESLIVRDYDGNPVATPPSGPLPILVYQHVAMDAAGTLRLQFDADAWDSTISFTSGIPVARGGTLELTFAPNVDVATQVGRTIDLFDWTGVTPTGAFTVSSPYSWDLSNLYTTGEVTLTTAGGAIPGDFNDDGIVDAADLADWKGDFGVNGESDADGDGDSDGADFLTWQRQLGQGAPAATLTVAVPEPTSLALLALGLPLLVLRNSQRVIAHHSAKRKRNPMTKYRTVLVTASLATLLSIFSPATGARADIFKWEYINPANPSEGKQQSTTLVPDGAGAHAVPGANLWNRDLTMAYLIGADLSPASSCTEEECITVRAYLFGTTLAHADLTNASFYMAILTGADLTGAEVRGANFYRDYDGTGISAAQLYSTASYQAHDLSGIRLDNNKLAGVNLVGQNLTNASFADAELTSANFTGAVVRGTSFYGYNTITAAQLYSTASYQAHDLTGINLSGVHTTNLAGVNLAGQNVTNANFAYADLTGANLTGAEVRGAYFDRGTLFGGITPTQLYSTASYQAHDLTGISLVDNNLAGVNLVGQNLTDARLAYADLTGANLTGAVVRGTQFNNLSGAGITTAQLYSTASYQAHDLSGISLGSNDLSGWNFAGQNLTTASFSSATLVNANFSEANLTHASFGYAELTGANLSQTNLTNSWFYSSNLTNGNLSGADARGANFESATLTGANTSNLIQSDGHIAGLDLTAGASLVVRDYNGNPAVYPTPTGPLPIVVDQSLAMDATGTLRLVFDADPWDSTISFAPGIPVALGGTLELTFAPDVNIATQSGRTIDLFDWTGVNPAGVFTVSSPYSWDLTKLYTTGEVTLTGAGTVIPGDFNGDHVVNAADLAEWKVDFGVNGHSDADGDGDSDGADFLSWQRQLSATASVASTAETVPEPTSALLVAVSMLAYRRRRTSPCRNQARRR